MEGPIQERRKAIHGGFGKNIPVFDNPELQ